MKELVCFSDEAAIVRILEIDVDVSRKGAIFVPNHSRTMREGNAGDLSKWDLRSGWRADQNSSHLLDIVPEVPLVAHVYGIAFATFDVLRDVLSADARCYCGLHIRNRKTVACGLFPVDIHVHVKTLRTLFSEARPHLCHSPTHILDLQSHPLHTTDIPP